MKPSKGRARVGMKGVRTYCLRPTVSANPRRSDLRWPRRKLFEELDIVAAIGAGVGSVVIA